MIAANLDFPARARKYVHSRNCIERGFDISVDDGNVSVCSSNPRRVLFYERVCSETLLFGGNHEVVGEMENEIFYGMFIVVDDGSTGVGG